MTDRKLKTDGTPRKERTSSLVKAQNELAKLKEKLKALTEQIDDLEEKCIQLYSRKDPDIKAKALGVAANPSKPKEAPADSSKTPASK